MGLELSTAGRAALIRADPLVDQIEDHVLATENERRYFRTSLDAVLSSFAS